MVRNVLRLIVNNSQEQDLSHDFRIIYNRLNQESCHDIPSVIGVQFYFFLSGTFMRTHIQTVFTKQSTFEDLNLLYLMCFNQTLISGYIRNSFYRPVDCFWFSINQNQDLILLRFVWNKRLCVNFHGTHDLPIQYSLTLLDLLDLLTPLKILEVNDSSPYLNKDVHV